MVNAKHYDFYKHYVSCESKQIIFSFNGKISDSVLQDIVAILEDKLTDHNIKKSFLRRIIGIIIELTQNIQRYSFRKSIDQDQENGHGMLVVRKVEEGFRIYAGNLVEHTIGEELIQYYNYIIKLNQESLKELYHKKLAAAADSPGIGLLHILRKTNSRMKIKVHRVNKTLAFLAFSILVR